MTVGHPIGAIHVGGSYPNGDLEFYSVDKKDVTSIEWNETEGLYGPIRTIRVYKKRQLHSEHIFHNCVSVYYLKEKAESGR